MQAWAGPNGVLRVLRLYISDLRNGCRQLTLPNREHTNITRPLVNSTFVLKSFLRQFSAGARNNYSSSHLGAKALGNEPRTNTSLSHDDAQGKPAHHLDSETRPFNMNER